MQKVQNVKIACPSCSAKYSIADEKVQDRLAKIRCRKCGTTIVIDGKASPPTVQAGDATGGSETPAGAAGHEYTVDVGENDQRSMSVDQIVEAYNNGAVNADTYVWKDGMDDWLPLADVPEINEALHAAASAQELPQAPAPARPSYTARASSDIFGTSASRSSLGGAADLFGGIDAAGSESDIATSAPDGANGGVSAATGARNESSVLFSLSALTAAQDEKPQAAPMNAEDSGLIDLAALTSSASSVAAMAPPRGMDFGPAPLAPATLGAAPLTGGTAAPLGLEVPPAPAGNKNGMFIGGGIVVAVLLAGMFAFLLKDDPQPVAAAPTTTVLVPTVIPSAPPAELAAADDSEQGANDADSEEETGDAKEVDEPDDKPATAANTPRRKVVYRPKKSTSSSGSESSGSGSSSKEKASSGSGSKKKAEPPKKKKKKSSCNCAPSDLMCAMKCSAK